MRIPFSWHLEHERKIPPKGQRHSAPLCVVRASEFRTPSKALFWLRSDFRLNETVVNGRFTCIIGASVHSRVLHAFFTQ